MSAAHGCPFHSAQGGVSLSEIPGIVRCGDRVRFERALQQLEKGLLVTTDLDEVRGQALTFIAMATAATMELGAPKTMHRVQLDAARKFDRMTNVKDIMQETRRILDQLLVFEPAALSTIAIDRALRILDKKFATSISDDALAAEVGLSTSHFRHLFRVATGQPFQKYLVSLRLEKARQLLAEGDMPVSDVAMEVGFAGLAHFSRAFSKRFSANPSEVRRTSVAQTAKANS